MSRSAMNPKTAKIAKSPTTPNAEQWRAEMKEAARRFAKPGVTPRERARELSGMELLQGMLDGRLPPPPIGATLEFLPIQLDRGRVVFQGEPKFDFYNPLGSVHGGWAATLLDSCMGCAIHSTLERGFGFTTLELKINFVRAVTHKSGPLRAEGRVIHPGRQAATAEGKLFDAAGKLYAHGTTTCLIFAV